MVCKISYFCHMIPNGTPFIDIHTHQFYDRQGCHDAATLRYYTYGIHPWCVENAPHFDVLKRLLQTNRLAAIGETGIDRLHKETLPLQFECFEKHILLSEQYQKPLIIHNVKATADILRFQKKHHPKQVWIIHGFNGSTEEARQLTSNGIFLSVGESIFYPNRKISQSIQSIPLDYLFFETDISEKTIQQIYEKASELLNLPLERLKQQIFSNFAHLNLTPWKTGNNAPDCSLATVALINLNEAMSL